MSAIRWRKGVRPRGLRHLPACWPARRPYPWGGSHLRLACPPRLPSFACRPRPARVLPMRRSRTVYALLARCPRFAPRTRATSSTCAARALEHALPHRAYLRTLDCAPPTQFPSAASRGGERAAKAGTGTQEHSDSRSRARANCTPPSAASVLRYFNSRLRMRANWKYAFPVVAI